MSKEKKMFGSWEIRFNAQIEKQKELKALRASGIPDTETMEQALWDNDVMMLHCIANELNHKLYLTTLTK
jgi:hypothetical protein